MHHDVIVQLAGSDEISLHTADPMPAEQASAWLDREFARLECVASRPSGKVAAVTGMCGVQLMTLPQVPTWLRSVAVGAGPVSTTNFGAKACASAARVSLKP